ncbi:hypothetical protein [Paenibacillus cookii]|uniref:HNH endonuclease n=1 Tax=Paenibacillus cookii TaxID=157839 RepID=A0ABQ4M4D4_9BACL|nr:hypothetical protein [Paenibacillus cookii]GIO70386.1 hypothetical protein J21TS3_52070 [Paenibacillus cookii]
MDFVDFLGDNRLRRKIVYTKGNSDCIYCGEVADSREHIPPKVFLTSPFPDNLGIVPACRQCNKSFSNDEVFLSILIEMLKRRCFYPVCEYSSEVERRMNYNKKIVSDIENVLQDNDASYFDDRIQRVLHKLALGHSVFEISEGYCIEKGTISYSFASKMSLEEIEEFTLPFNITGEPLPEIGSRVYERILIIEHRLQSVENSEMFLVAPLVLLDWVDVQDFRYSYTCYRFANEIIVKMVINEFLYATVAFNLKPDVQGGDY